MKIIKAKDFDFVWFRSLKEQKRNPGNPARRSKKRYINLVTAFDIETTNIEEIEQSVMYIWQWAFGPDLVVVGRTWDEFKALAENLAFILKEHQQLVIFVHNLSFEFQFLKGIYDFGPDEVFAMDPRKILKCTMYNGKLEFRCSYLQTNMSLAEFTEKMGAAHSKLSGEEFDYSKKRYPWTPLSKEELSYCINDVAGLVEAITIEMQHDHDTTYTLPLTSTGYVRRDAKRALKYITHDWAKKQAPNWHVFTLLRWAFRGGNTHANRFIAGEVIEGKIYSFDRSSSYPDVLVNHKFPDGRFYEIGECSKKKFNELYRVMERAILMKIEIKGLRLKAGHSGCPYLSKDKAEELAGGVFDNGRILSCDHMVTCCTDVDYSIIEDMYTWDDIRYLDVCYTRYRYLPKVFRDLVCEYYERKTALKGVESEELNYFRAKQKLNSLYGMCATLPIRPTLEFIKGEYIPKDEDPQKLLYIDSLRRVLPPYQVGVWCTAWARWELQRAIIRIEQTPGAVFLYTDTDSVKYVGNVDFSDYNAEKVRNSKKNGAFAQDPKGNTHYMGVFEEDGIYQKFITLGAKKYAYEDLNGELHITVAGVIKKKGAKELAKKGGIYNFKPNFVFTEAGGLEAVYNDDPEIKTYIIDGHELKITSNVMLRDSTYTLGITNEYEKLLAICRGFTLDLF